ncbi:hypothetical protein BJX66DRAFT_299370 [Aspergillus keveii]|uniref:Uncharacterized protein n=1 Tax=Aspergillus keveii TaxID=714993 RepID=A0ABR4GD11_9EURO
MIQVPAIAGTIPTHLTPLIMRPDTTLTHSLEATKPQASTVFPGQTGSQIMTGSMTDIEDTHVLPATLPPLL